ncbi:acyltransferase [Vitiosangium sp. GDMCC 1.1324]|uniref:acyltransferase family protein n=1 Tax=Vitiosangium sp. (strain GDMCC 1.1324) TaxID=2138576 RepID=UPI000D381BE9|nr:acyltransferase [Vitiosangium sp. GDMCC 1.1324]PTL80417.1 hypothetical protein DAT35_27645 [Vitiosangium sp. GDMCC 1.1324]
MDGTDPFFLTLESRWHWVGALSALAVALATAAWLLRRDAFFRKEVEAALADPSYNTQLEGLRGLLATGVFLCHAIATRTLLTVNEWKHPPHGEILENAGTSSVMIFFFITGYLFWSRARKGPLHPVAFLRARVRRLVPAYLASVGAIFLIVAVLSGGTPRLPLAVLGKQVVDSLTFCLFTGYFQDLNGVPLANLIDAGVVWSLRFEWMFYALLPAIAWAAPRWRWLWLAVGLAVFRWACPSPVLQSILDATRFAHPYFLHGFLPGMLIAYLVELAPFQRLARSGVGQVLPPLLAGWLTVTMHPEWDLLHSAVFGSAFALVAGGSSVFGLLKTRPLLCLGKMSYSIYLFHGIVLFLVTRTVAAFVPMRSIPMAAYWGLIAATSVGVIAVSGCVYRYVEWPFLRKETAKRREVLPAAVPLAK